MSNSNSLTLTASTMLMPATVIILVALVIPTLILLRYSFNVYDPTQLMIEAFTLENYGRFFSEPYFQKVMVTTLTMSLECTLASLLLGYPVALFLATTTSRFKSLFIILTIFPLLVGNVVRAAGWMTLFGAKGFINVSLMYLGVIDEPINMMYTTFSVFVGILCVILPFMILTLQGVLESIDFSLTEAAKNLGASSFTAFRRIILPLSLPGIATGCILVFILCMNAYSTPVLLGGPSFAMMAPALYDQIAATSNWPFGAALAFILTVATILATLISSLYFRRRLKALAA
ncbi:ABC transporter permease [Sneathiella litorea]|uniref:ABC transporter permease subunit n=1 Tax=Sneathiella litorea TaxID=2606216 RepID=A0A6L8W5P5_9PROT|nr:ABC transporter permease [Sneathiella litorea]MZR30401.1 ABC transporter permease subunit [Sneathiella litorea]